LKFSLSKILSIKIPPNRIFGLDIIRAAAIFFVVLGHSVDLVPYNIGTALSHFIIDGVTLFFVLSGFLIGRILIKTFDNNGITINDVKNFWIRRWFRTLPNYFLILTLLIILHLIFSPDFRVSWIPSYYSFTQNLFYPHPWFFPEAWSLSIEEWFYFTIPIILFLFIKIGDLSSKRAFVTTSVILIILCPLLRYYRFSQLEELHQFAWDNSFRKQVITRLDSLMIGVFGAILYIYKKAHWSKYQYSFLVLGLFILIGTTLCDSTLRSFKIYYYVFSFSLVPFATLLTLPFFSNFKKSSGFIFRCVTILSLISYSIYLVHLTLIQGFIVKYFPFSEAEGSSMTIVRFGLYWMVSIIVSILIFKYFESPMTRLRERFSPD